MNGQYFGERVNSAEVGEKTDQDVNPQEENLVPYIDSGLADPPEIYQSPVHEAIVQESPKAPMAPEAPATTIVGAPTPLLSQEESNHFRSRWNEIQGKFVDEPRAAVQEADALVTMVSDQIAKMFANEHNTLEGQWKQGNDVSTEDLRVVLQRYRSFFNRLVV